MGNTNCIYLIKGDQSYCKYGKTCNMNSRIKDYERGDNDEILLSNPVIIKVWKVHNHTEIENILHDIFRDVRKKAKSGRLTEYIKMNKTKAVEQIDKIVEEHGENGCTIS